MVTSIDPNLLMSIYNSRAGLASAGSAGSTSSATTKKVAPTAPWYSQPTEAEASAAVKSVLAGHRFINESAAKLDLPSASADYKKLFAMYQGLSTLADIVTQAQKKNVSAIDLKSLQNTFAKGMAEVSTYLKDTKLEQLRLTAGAVATSAKTTMPVQAAKSEYVTAPIYAGDSGDAVPAFQGDVKFTISVKDGSNVKDIQIDLSEMPGTRSMSSVVAFINGKLSDAGVDARFGTQRIAGTARTTKVGDKTITLGTNPDQWAFKVIPNNETITFSATATAGAVYMAQSVGNPNPDGIASTNDAKLSQQFVKLQTDTDAVPAPAAGLDSSTALNGRIFTKTLGAEVQTVRKTVVGSDGSVYMLADITAATGGQDIKGAQDVALLKYDAAGNLVYSRTLGASDSATGLGLALSADGKIAVAGSVSGGLSGAVEGPMNSGTTGVYADQADSFVTVFNADGEELWTQRRGARMADEASQVSFGADGSVYVAGRTQSAMPNGGATIGGYDTYLEAFSPPDATGKVAANFTTTFGTAGSDKPAGMVVDGNAIVTATVEGGHAVLRRFDISSGSPVLMSTRDLGDLQGGDIAGLALDNGKLVLAGTTGNGSLAGGSVTRAYSGGTDAFAMQLSADLSAGAGDAIAYYGGSGNDKATALSVAGGQVYIGGIAGTDLPNEAQVGTQDGFLAKLDIGTGAIGWSERFTGKEGYAAPTSIAFDPTGASGLDKLGLPKGTLDLSDSQKVTSVSSLRAGDQFTVRVGTGLTQTVTIDANDTLDSLALKIKRASGFQVTTAIGLIDGQRKLTITPLNGRSNIEFGAGKTDKNALAMLGIPEGVVRNTKVDKNGVVTSADGKGQFYGLGLDSDLNLADTDQMSHAAAEIAKAMGVIRQAYKDLVAAASPRTAQSSTSGSATGQVPAYLTSQIANYQAALSRLTGGS